MASEDTSQQQPLADLELQGKITEIHKQSIVFSFVVFSFFAFFAVCFIYTLYLCTHRWQHGVIGPRQPMGRPTAAANHSASFPLPQLGHDVGPFFGPQTRRLGLDMEAINSLPTVSYGSPSFNKDVDCPICLSSFQHGEIVKLLPQCLHVFHSECLDKWLVAQPNCPLCRTQVHSADQAR